jgi:hypothetical protein
MLLQNHIGPELKSHQTESQIFVQTPSFQTYTKTKLIDQQTRHRFRLIQENVNRYIDLQIKRLNDQSTPLVCNQNIQQRCNGSRTGGSEEQYAEIVHPPPSTPAHRPHSQTSQIKKLPQPKASKDTTTMPNTQLEAICDVHLDVLSTLKDTSYFTYGTTRAHINSLHIDSFKQLKYRVKKIKVRCERGIRACTDGHLLAPRNGKFQYYHRLFGDLLETLQRELDRVLEIQEYMEQQEGIIKFRSDHYNEFGVQTIHNRQATPFTQCYQNVMASVASTPAQSPSSPEYSKASSSSDESDNSDESDSESDATPKIAWSVSSDSSSDEDE